MATKTKTLTTKEAATVCGISPDAFRRATLRLDIHPVDATNRYTWRPADVKAIKKHCNSR